MAMKSFGISKKQPKMPSIKRVSQYQAGSSVPGGKGSKKKGK